MPQAAETWVAIEVTRQMRLVDGAVADAGALSAAGVNLLEHQVGIARQIAGPDRIVVLTPQSDETVLEIIGRHELREVAPFDFIRLMRERSADDAAVVLLRQYVPLADARDLKLALTLAAQHPTIISASKPPAGHPRHKPVPGQSQPDYRCLAFEVRRAAQFGAAPGHDEHLLFIEWESFAEYLHPRDEPEVAARLKTWSRPLEGPQA